MRTIICAVVALCAAACTNASTVQPAVAQVDGNHHVVVRAEAGHLWWSHRAWTEPHELCTLPAHGPVENLAVEANEDGFVVSFEQGGTKWTGSFGSVEGAQTLVARRGQL